MKTSIFPPEKISIYLVIISTWILFMVHFLQHFFEIYPCSLCVWQRYPYFAILIGAILVPLHKEILALWIQKISLGLNMLLSLYHSGLERHFWGGISSCAKTEMSSLPIDKMLSQLEQTPLVKCDEISFHIGGITLTNMNFLISTFLLGGGIYFYQKWKKNHET